MASGGNCMVVAIDFGTTYSGFAYGTGASVDDIKLNDIWDNSFGLDSYKTATSALINDKGELEEFGFDAEYKYSHLCANKDADTVELYKNFKMLLYDSEDINRTTKIKSVRGKEKEAIDVFALSLEKLKSKFLETVESSDGRKPIESEIKWVITIPTIWSDKAKFFMREAAFKGGLISTLLSTQLTFALEPEAASLYIHALKTNEFQGFGSSDQSPVEFKIGTKYMVVDAGGGTVDITAHEVVSEGKVKELIPASGGNWGGYNVNIRFHERLNTIFGEKFINAYKTASPHKWLEEFEILFERKKRANRPDGATSLDLPITKHFDRKYKEITHSDLENLRYTGSGISLRDDALSINIGGILDLYHEDFGRITDHLYKLLEQPQLQDLKYIFLVGGFAEDAFFCKAVAGLFSSHLVLTPKYLYTAAMRGAVIFGHNTNMITSRRARKSYGYKVLIPFVEGRHDQNKKTLNEVGEEYCDDIFNEVVHAGEEIQSNEERTFPATTFSSSDTEVTISFYCTEQNGAKYVDEPHMEKVYETNLKLEDTTGGRNRKVDVKVKFGGTELLVEAWDPREGGQKVEMSMDFLST